MISKTVLFCSLCVILINYVIVGCQSDVKVYNMCVTDGDFAMTFDQGPSIFTGIILDAAKNSTVSRVRFTFHVLPNMLSNVIANANVRRAYQEGHTIGLSLDPLLDLTNRPDEEILALINRDAKVIEEVIDSPTYRVKYLRIPQLSQIRPSALQLIYSNGYYISMYNLDSYDYRYTEDRIVQEFKNVVSSLTGSTKGGFISVQRDTVEASALAVSRLVNYLTNEKAYQLVSIGKCIGKENADASNVPTISKGSGSNNNDSFFLPGSPNPTTQPRNPSIISGRGTTGDAQTMTSNPIVWIFSLLSFVFTAIYI